jgi:autotransporter-associated beta strand protein
VYGNNSKLLTSSGIMSREAKTALEEYPKLNSISGSSFTGDVQINNGEFWVGTNGTMGSGTIKVGNTSTTNTTKLYMSNSGVTVSRSIIVGSGNASTRYIGGVQSSGSSTFSGNVDLSAQTSNATNFDVLTSGTSIEFSGIISGTNSGANKIGSGIAIFAAANTYTGAKNINGGKLTIQGSGTAGTGALTSASAATLESSVSLANSSITVNGTYNITDNITVNDLTINSGATLSSTHGKTSTIPSGYALTLNKQSYWGTANIILAGTATMTESATNYVITNSTGTLTRTVGASQVTFPIGLDASNYNPVKITNSGTSRAFAVYAKSTPSTATYNGNYVNCFWNITPNDGGVVGTLVFQWNSTQHGTGFVYNDPTLHIGRWTGTVWDPKLATLGGSDPYTATATGFTAFSEFGVGSNGALPVELTSFNAAIRNGLVDLKWETATEVNNYGFEVERKTASADWSKIGFVEGHNSTNSPKYYSYSDKPEGTGKIAYRLKQIDNDGQFEYSPEVEVLVDNLPNGFVLEQNYPNPFNPETSIRFALKEDTKATLKVYNSLGAEIATLFDGTAEAGRYYDVKFGGSELASGFYIYKLVAGEYVSVKKMLLMK